MNREWTIVSSSGTESKRCAANSFLKTQLFAYYLGSKIGNSFQIQVAKNREKKAHRKNSKYKNAEIPFFYGIFLAIFLTLHLRKCV